MPNFLRLVVVFLLAMVGWSIVSSPPAFAGDADMRRESSYRMYHVVLRPDVPWEVFAEIPDTFPPGRFLFTFQVEEGTYLRLGRFSRPASRGGGSWATVVSSVNTEGDPLNSVRLLWSWKGERGSPEHEEWRLLFLLHESPTHFELRTELTAVQDGIRVQVTMRREKLAEEKEEKGGATN